MSATPTPRVAHRVGRRSLRRLVTLRTAQAASTAPTHGSDSPPLARDASGEPNDPVPAKLDGRALDVIAAEQDATRVRRAVEPGDARDALELRSAAPSQAIDGLERLVALHDSEQLSDTRRPPPESSQGARA